MLESRRTGLQRQRVSPILPSDKEREEHDVTHATFRSWCEACVAGRATEDAHRRSAKESSVPLVAMDYGFLGRDTDVDLATILVLAQRPHGAVGACQVLRKGPEPYAIDCVLAYLDSWALVEVTLKADNEPAIQALADGIKRGERTMVEKSPKYSHQSNGVAENAVRRIESLIRTYVYVLQKKLSYKVDSKSIILPWLVRHAAYVLSRYIKRDDGRSAWARLRGKECDSPLAQIGETVDFKVVRGAMAKLEPRWITGTFLGRTDESDEVIVGTAAGIEFARSFRRRTSNKQWERDAFTTFIGVPWNPRVLAVEAPMASSKRRYITKAFIRQHGETPGCAACLGTASQHTAKCRERFERMINPSATEEVPATPSPADEIQQPDGGAAPMQQQQQAIESSTGLFVQQASGTKRGMEDGPAPPSAKRSHTPPPVPSQISPQPDVEMSERRVPDDAMEINALCEEQVDQPNFERFFDKAGEFYDRCTGEILDRDATIAGIRAELAQMQEFGVFEWRRSSEKPAGERVISSKMFHKAKGDEVRSRMVAWEYADGVFAPEHHAGTPPTWALKLVLSRMVSKGRTRQFASHDVSVAFFHAWLEQGVWVKPPRELRLGDDWLWYVVKALCGMRESSKAFQDVVRNMYLEYEWTMLQTVPCLAYSSKLDTLSGWHGDDFYTEGEPEALDEMNEMILRTFKAKVLPRLGPGANMESTILRRTLKWSTEGVHLTPDAKHVENLAGLLEVKGAKPSPTPCSRATGRGQRDVLEPLAAAEATVFRRGTGIALYLGPDRFDLQFATKELAQDMQTPSKLSMMRLRRPVLAWHGRRGTFLRLSDGAEHGTGLGRR